MAETIGSIQVVASINTKDYDLAKKRIEKGNDELEGNAKSTSKGFSAAWAGAIGGFVAALTQKGMNLVSGSIGSAVKRIDTLNNSTRTFENMGISSSKSTKAVERLTDSIRGLPTPLDGAVRGMTALTATYGDVNRGQKVFSALNNAILGFGGSADMVDNAIMQLSQLPMDGPLDAQTWNSLRNSGLTPVLTAMAKESKMSVSEMRKAFGEGELTVEDFTNRLVKMNEKGGGGLKSLSKIAKDSTEGISTGFANMNTAVARGMANIVGAIGSKRISSGLSAIGSAFESNLTAAAGHIGNAVDHIIDLGKTVSSYLMPALKGLWDGVTKNLLPAIKNIYTSPIVRFLGGLFVAAIKSVIQVGTWLVNNILTPMVNVLTNLAPIIIGVAGAMIAYRVAMTALNVVNTIQNTLAALTATRYVMLNGALVTMRTATTAQTVAQGALNAIMRVNPFVAVATAVGGLGAALLGLVGSANSAKNAEDRLNASKANSVALSNKVRTAEQSVANARLAQQGSALAVERAQRSLDEAVTSYGRNSLEAREAQHNLTLAQEEQKKKSLELARENINLNISLEQLKKQAQLMTNTDKTRKYYVDELSNSIVSQNKDVEDLTNRLRNLNNTTVEYRVRGILEEPDRSRGLANGGRLPGFATGGFTGRGGKNEAAGIVHRGEYVVPKNMVNQATGLPEIGGRSIEYNIGEITISSEVDGERWLRRLTENQEIVSNGLTPRKRYA